MKAKINGIEVEGTPQEIHELMVEMGPVKLTLDTPKGSLSDQTGVFVKITTTTTNTNNTAKKCSYPCYCTGECIVDSAAKALINGAMKAGNEESLMSKYLK